MDSIKMLFFALLTLIGVTVGIFLMGSFIVKLLGIAFVFTIQHAIVVVIGILLLKYLIHFLFINSLPQIKDPNMENELQYLRDSNLGLTMILGALIKYHGGEVKIPTFIVSQITEEVEVEHTTDYANNLEVFTLIKGDKNDDGKNSLN